MLTGRRPFDGSRDITIAHAILHDEPTRPCELRAELSPVVEAVVHSLLQKDREHRPATAELVDAHLAAAELGRLGHSVIACAVSTAYDVGETAVGAGAAALVLLAAPARCSRHGNPRSPEGSSSSSRTSRRRRPTVRSRTS
jgi:hypothetical protein